MSCSAYLAKASNNGTFVAQNLKRRENLTVSKEGSGFRFKGKRIFYGWGIVAALFLIMFVLWGGYYSFGVFFNPLSQEFGSTGTLTSGIMSLSLIMGGLFTRVMGALTDR